MPKLTRVIRLDGRPLTRAEYTPEGYLDDRPIITSVGIFEYTEPDGSVRRELRLPEEVFNKESLGSLKAKPIIITHEAGLIDKDNVAEEQIGTILTAGYRDGDNVRAEIVIHNTDKMKACGFKELSCGYNIDLDETPGVYNGQKYDAIQRNIRYNHLALVENARAGEQARLNIDSRDKKSNTGGKKPMAKNKNARRTDGLLSPEELQKAIAEYKAKYGENNDADEKETAAEVVESSVPTATVADPKTEKEDADTEVVGGKMEEGDIKGQVKEIAERREDDEDIQKLRNIIDTLLAQKAFDDAGETGDDPFTSKKEEEADGIDDFEKLKGDGDDDEDDENLDGDDDDEEENMDCGDSGKKLFDGKNCEECDSADDDPMPGQNTDLKTMNTDSIDRIVRERVKVGLIGRKINLDGLEDLSLMAAKKAVIRAVRPGIRLDGESNAFINALYECCADDIKSRETKDTRYQKRQMFNKDAAEAMKPAKLESTSARERMIAAQRNHKKED